MDLVAGGLHALRVAMLILSMGLRVFLFKVSVGGNLDIDLGLFADGGLDLDVRRRGLLDYLVDLGTITSRSGKSYQ